MMKPNLFDFATSELSQDAVLAWLIAWSDSNCSAVAPELHKLGTQFLRLLAGGPDHATTKVQIRKQEGNIDLLCLINDDRLILIEDKVGTTEHSDQLRRYQAYVHAQDDYKNRQLSCVYVQTGDQSDFKTVTDAGYSIIRRSDLLDLLQSQAGQEAGKSSDIVRDFSQHLLRIETAVQAYKTVPVSKWRNEAWIGFFQVLQDELNEGNWGWVPFPGDFMGFWWKHCEDREHHCVVYLQLEEGKLCFKLAMDRKEGRKAIANLWSERIVKAGKSMGVTVVRPSRIHEGTSMTVAQLPGYRACDERGTLDLAGTVTTIRKAEQVAVAVCQGDRA